MAAKSHLNFGWSHPSPGPWDTLETMGCGCAFLDYDQDGWMDIFLVGRSRCALFHNNHDGTFTDVSSKAGITKPGNWQGVAVGDFDNDGYPDIYVSGRGGGLLLHNNGNGTFSDVTKQAGVDDKEWGTCCAFFDADGDGKLDLIVGHYVASGSHSGWLCPYLNGKSGACRPQTYAAQFPKLYHNQGNGKFVDVTARSGLKASYGKNLAIQFCDYDNDGKLDFYIANDTEPGDLFHNLGNGRFENVSIPEGTAFDMDGAVQGGMSVDFSDYDHDGKMDLIVSTYETETFSLYHHVGGAFEITSVPAGLGVTRAYVGFGAKFIDFDNDGWPDLVFADGHLLNNANEIDPGRSFRQPLLLFHNESGHFKQVLNAGPGFSNPIVGRGLAVGDVENDGSQDLLVVDYDGHPLLLHNASRSPNHWLGVKLVGTRSNRDGYGARVTLKWAGGQTFADCTAAGSYCSSMDPRIHFGIGKVTAIPEVDVRWPTGKVTRVRDVAADRYVTIRESA